MRSAAPAPIAVPARPIDLLATLALALAAVLPPIAFVALPQLIGLIGPLPTAASLIGAVVLAPAAVGVGAALLGTGEVRARFAARGDKEHEYAVCRILGQTLLLAWALGIAAVEPGSAAAACLLIATLALVGGWAFLLHLILSPRASAVRRYAAIVLDLMLLSGLLHFGQADAAIWYPAYLAMALYAGLRFGFGALVTAAVGGVVGFGAVAATTPLWQAQPGLAIGLAAMLAAMPAGVATLIRALARSREEADAASAAQTRFLSVIGQGLRGPVDAMARMLPEAETVAGLELPAQALLQQISEVLDLAEIETGAFAPETEPFDLHAVVNGTLALLRPAAVQRGLALSLRLDPHVPYRLSGWPQQFAQILNSLVIAAIAASDGGTIRVDVRAAGTIDAVVPLRITVCGQGGVAEGDFDLVVVGRLAELMGGRVVAEGPAAWAVSLPLALDETTMPAPLDLAQRPVLLVTEDSQFAGEVAEPLGAWNADTRWVGGLDDALVYVERFETPLSPVLIIDGRVRVIPALSFVHRAALVRDDPPPILFVADTAQIGALSGIGDGELAGLLPAPVSDRLLENALHALPAIAIQAVLAATEHSAVMVAQIDADERVTPIAAHPRYMAEPAVSVDTRVIAGLRNLSGNGNFFAEVVDSFRTDSRQIMDRIAAAADASDLAAFSRSLHALRRCAATVGGTGLCELTTSLRGITAAELRQQDAAIVQRLAAELARFNSALVESLPRAG